MGEWTEIGLVPFVFTWGADTAWALGPALLEQGVFALRALLPHLYDLHLL